jgi:L-seryl-tRNA(Ser) seleniumtransferase
MTTDIRALYTRLPATDRLLRDPAFSAVLARYGHAQVVALLRQMLEEAREYIRQQQALPDWCDDWPQETGRRLAQTLQSALRPVFNLTGTVLHTNLGRAIQAEAAVDAVAQAMRAPVTLEYIWTMPGAATAIGRWRSCCAASPARKMPVSSTTTRRRCC